MAEQEKRNFPYVVAWIGFLASVIIGAGLLLSPSPTRQLIGFIMLFAPILIFGALMGLFYWRSRRLAEDDST